MNLLPKYIAIGASIGVSMLSFFSHNYETARSKQYPLAFSEISQIERIGREEGIQLSATATVPGKSSDMFVKIAEASNKSYKSSEKYEVALRNELEWLIDPANHTYTYNLADFLVEVPKLAQNVLDEQESLLSGISHAKGINTSADESWKYNSYDNYHTEYIEVESTDSEGNTTTDTYPIQVYDDTDHYFTFNSPQGYELLEKLIVWNDRFSFVEDVGLKVILPKVIQEPNATAISSSSKKELTEEEIREQALKAYSGIKLFSALDSAYLDSSKLATEGVIWEDELTHLGQFTQTRQKDGRYRVDRIDPLRFHVNTSWTSDNGPRGNQVADRIQNESASFLHNAQYVRDSMHELIADTKELDNLVGDFVYGKPTEKSAKELVNHATSSYVKLFPNGLDLRGYRGWAVFGFSALGLVAGGASGFGLGRYKQKQTNQSIY